VDLGKRMSKRRLVFMGSLYVLVSALSVGLAQGVAYAGNWVYDDGSYKAGNSEVYFALCNLKSNTHDWFHDNDSHDIEPTDITTVVYHDCENVDVAVHDYDYASASSE
jgi:hypothetical protein